MVRVYTIELKWGEFGQVAQLPNLLLTRSEVVVHHVEQLMLDLHSASYQMKGPGSLREAQRVSVAH